MNININRKIIMYIFFSIYNNICNKIYLLRTNTHLTTTSSVKIEN